MTCYSVTFRKGKKKAKSYCHEQGKTMLTNQHRALALLLLLQRCYFLQRFIWIPKSSKLPRSSPVSVPLHDSNITQLQYSKWKPQTSFFVPRFTYFSFFCRKKQCFLIGDGGLKGIWQGYRSGHRAFSIVATCSSCVTASAYDSPSTKHTMFRETTHQAGHAGTNEQFANTQEAEICWLEMYKTPELHRRGDS